MKQTLFVTFLLLVPTLSVLGYGTGQSSRQTTTTPEPEQATSYYSSQRRPEQEYDQEWTTVGQPPRPANDKYSQQGSRYPDSNDKFESQRPGFAQAQYGEGNGFGGNDGEMNYFGRENHLERYGFPKDCVFSPYYKQACEFYVEISRQKNSKYPESLLFELSGRLKSDGGYLGVGLSKDKKMGQDHIIECVKPRDNGRPTMYHSWAEGQSRPERLQDDIELFKSEDTYPRYDPISKTLTCKFWRRPITSIQVKGRIVEFNLMRDKYYILLARGPVETRVGSEGIGYHGDRPEETGNAYVSQNLLGYSKERFPEPVDDDSMRGSSKKYRGSGRAGSGYIKPMEVLTLIFTAFAIL